MTPMQMPHTVFGGAQGWMDGRTGWAAAKRTHIPSLVSPHNPFLVPIEVKFERKFSSAPFRGHVMPLREGVCAPSHHMNLKRDH
jgi:hypothetical protein